jgi:hypothetical protein
MIVACRKGLGNRPDGAVAAAPQSWMVIFRVVAWILLAPILTTVTMASTGGSVSGNVRDPQGSLVPNAKVTIINAETNLRYSISTSADGVYSFRDVPIGKYELEVETPGFKRYRQTGIVLNTDSSLLVDIVLTVGEITTSIEVTHSVVSVETSNTQLGDVVSSEMILGVPLNGRSYTDLLALQPGVTPITTITGTSIQAAGASVISSSGNLDPGTISINGQREYANGFTVNDADVVERFTMGAAIIPNLDAISEFRVLTGNFDAEYGNYSGGRIQVVTKAGENQYHGSALDYLRNTSLDAKNYFSHSRGVYQQNQFGGTLGGPISKDHAFFFVDYQGTRLKQGVDSGNIAVPTSQERMGDFSDPSLARSFQTVDANGNLVATKVSGNYFANLLSQRLGYPVSSGEPYYYPGCTSFTQCVLPNAQIPKSAWSVPASRLLQYIPAANTSDGFFATSVYNKTLRDDKAAIRLDENHQRLGQVSAYYMLDDYYLNNPYATQQGGANVPGFNAITQGRAQMLTLGDSKTFGMRTVNEFHFSYVRDANILGYPVGGVGPSLVSQGFVTADGKPSIIPARPGYEGIENINFNNFIIGPTITGLNQYDNTFEFRDGFSRIIGKHALKLGGEFLYSQVNALADVQSNGSFLFTGSETGIDFADFLLGIPSTYKQGNAQAFYNRNKYLGLFAQDTWRVTQRLVLNYGLRWDIIMPWYEKYNQIQTLIPGQKSIVFPGAPTGLVFPGDPGISRSLAPARWNNLAPRIGLAYSPAPSNSVLRLLLGESGQSSIRLGFGKFFSAVEGVSAGVMAGDAPYGQTYSSTGPPLFSNPFITASSGFDNGQRFPLHFPPLNASASNPNPNINWSNYLPISGLPGYYPGNITPYSEQYTLSLQRQISSRSLLTITYVGSQSHHLLALLEANPGNPALCLSLSQKSQVAPGTPTCGPFGESSSYTSASGRVYQGTRGPFGSDFGSVDWLITNANSNYNALEITYRYSARRAEFLAGYTYSKSMDNSSSISDQLVPTNYRLTYGLSAFDIRQNFVASTRYELPLETLFKASNLLTKGWEISGIARFASGLPVTFYNNSDNSLLGTGPDGVNAFLADLPQMSPGPLKLNGNPRNGQPYFNTSLFSVQPLGTPGNVSRRFFSGPGMHNFDLALSKNIPLRESCSLQFRLEAFNAFNHAQFFGPNTVNATLPAGSTFGQITNADPPRLVQAALRLTF